jgi:trehalose 6-phosphate phosphatase
MRRLFSNEGEAALAHAMQRQPLLAFDFDGTLAPIVARPEDARVPAPVAQRLQRLAERLPLAIITGRSVSDVRQRLPFAPWRVIGNHGAEDETLARMTPTLADLDPARQRIQAHAAALRESGVRVEDKGASVALHYRLARNREAALAAIRQALDGLPPELVVFGGKMVANVAAAWAHDKAQALATLVQESGAPAAFFVGDDINDEPVFARNEPHWFTVRVGREFAASRAQFVVDSPADLPRLLDLMWAGLPGAA